MRRRENSSFENRSSRPNWRLVLCGTYVSPFTGEGMSVREAIELCGFWRQLIDKNCELGGGLGFAFWKQDNVGALMWGGVGAVSVPADSVGDSRRRRPNCRLAIQGAGGGTCGT